MKTYTEQQILDKVKEIWGIGNGNDLDKTKAKVSIKKSGEVDITLSAMYDPPKLNLPLLISLGKFFDTMNINDDDRFSHGGCETCDYGSSYGFTLTVRPEK